MTPEIDVEEFPRDITTRIKRQDTLYGLPNGSINNVAMFRFPSITRQHRPASSTSPIRADGSRAPLPWSNSWASCTVPYRDFEIDVPTGWPWGLRYWGNMPLVAFDSSRDQIPIALGLGWVTPSGGFFPYECEARARTKFLLALQDSAVQWGATLGEMRETVKGLGAWSSLTLDFVQASLSAYRQAKRNPKRFLRSLKSVPMEELKKSLIEQKAPAAVINAWLGYQFGVRPLVADIESSATALDSLVNGDNYKAPAMMLKKGALVKDIYTCPWYNSAFPYYQAVQDFYVACSCHISCRYDAEVRRGVTLGGLGLTNPPSVAWEVISFSWMVDYFVQVGDWLQSLAPVDGAQFVEGSISRKVEIEQVSPVRFNPTGGSVFRKGFGPLSVDYKAGRFEREVLTHSVLPAYRPPWRFKMGLPQLANSLAAITQIMA